MRHRIVTQGEALNENPAIQKWAMRAVLTAALMPLPHAIHHAYADTPAQQGVARQLSVYANDSLPVTTFYQGYEETLFWQDGALVASLAEALGRLEDDGLTPGDYRAKRLVDDFRVSQQAGAAAQARFDIETTQTLLLALDHLSQGKVGPQP